MAVGLPVAEQMAETRRNGSEWSGDALDRAFGAPPPEYVFYLLLQANRRREMALSAGLEAVGLSVPMWHAGAVIRRLRGCSMTEVAHLSAVDRTTLTRTIDRMVMEGLVTRASSPVDRRRVMLELSERGVELIDRARVVSREINQRFLHGAAEHHLTPTLRLLQHIVDKMVAEDDVAYGVLTYSAISSDKEG